MLTRLFKERVTFWPSSPYLYGNDDSGGRVSLAWFRWNKFRLHPSHDCVAGPPVHEATGGHAIQTYPTATWMLQITQPFQSRGTSRAIHRACISASQWRKMAFRLLDEDKKAASSRHFGHTAPWNATCPARWFARRTIRG